MSDHDHRLLADVKTEGRKRRTRRLAAASGAMPTALPGSPFITRSAPGFGTNIGGGIEAVVPEGGVWLRGFSYFGPKGL